MAQSDPTPQLFRHAQDTPQGKDLKLIKVLVDRGLQQRFQLMHAVLDLLPRFGILDVAVAIGVSNRQVGRGLVGRKGESRGRLGEEARLDGGDGAVDDGVDRVDDVVDQRLAIWSNKIYAAHMEGCTSGVY